MEEFLGRFRRKSWRTRKGEQFLQDEVQLKMSQETHGKFRARSLLPIGGSCILLGVILSSTLIGLPLGIPLVILGCVLAPIGLLAKSR